VSRPEDASRRLLELKRILASSPRASAGASSESADAASLILHSVPAGRIRETTSLLNETRGTEVDAADALAMRLLLLDYVGAVERLRAVTKLADERLARARIVIRRGANRVERAVQEGARFDRDTAEREEP
jgi:hypothetical protein